MDDILERSPPPFDERVSYGPGRQQFAEIRFPNGGGPFPFLFVIHGGFWQAKYDLKHTGHLCADLTSRGIVTCNLEYRRVGETGGGWPGTFLDVGLAADHIGRMVSTDNRIDSNRIAVIGHSAGGHLALWLVSRHKIPKDSPLHQVENCRIERVVSLAGVGDLREASNQHLGRGIVSRLMGGAPEEHRERYNAGSPFELLPNGARTVLIHGAEDDVVPISQSESYVERARDRGDNPELLRLDGVGHFELIDPTTDAWRVVAEAVLGLFKV